MNINKIINSIITNIFKDKMGDLIKYDGMKSLSQGSDGLTVEMDNGDKFLIQVTEK